MGKRKNQFGFGAIEAVLIVVILGIIGGAGYFVMKANQNIDSTNNITAASSATTPSTKKTTSNSPKTAATTATDPYTGWKKYCDASTGGCFRYPADFADTSELSAQGIKAFTQNKAGTINIEYSEPVTGKGGLGSFNTVSLSELTTANSSYKVVGGYYATGNVPSYSLIDASLVTQFGLTLNKTSTISGDNDLLFTSNSNKATLTTHLNNTSGNPSISTTTANNWLNSADGKTALLIVQSYYKE